MVLSYKTITCILINKLVRICRIGSSRKVIVKKRGSWKLFRIGKQFLREIAAELNLGPIFQVVYLPTFIRLSGLNAAK